ncbi:hypothetical protein F5887DRAFT_514327 [Amanita rubescens]|nr:hypothetical protein F5887DRAFT_514327 [Amanita rubescens]
MRLIRMHNLMHLKLVREPKISIKTIHRWNTDTTMHLAQVIIYVFCSLVLGEAEPAYMRVAHPTMHMVATSRFLNPYMTRRTRLGSVARCPYRVEAFLLVRVCTCALFGTRAAWMSLRITCGANTGQAGWTSETFFILVASVCLRTTWSLTVSQLS